MTDVVESVAAKTGGVISASRPARKRISDTRVDYQPGFVLHAYAWRETSLIVESFTQEFGRVAVVARGAKRPTSQFRGLLLPFNPIALSWSGRNEIKTLVRAEWLGGMQPLRGDALLAAFYANELLVRLLARGDAHPQTFGSYVELLQALAHDMRHETALRRFELSLLQDIGYAVTLDCCSEGRPIEPSAQYVYYGGHGARLADDNIARHIEVGYAECAISGRTLLAMASRDFEHPQVAAESKTLLRQVIHYHLDGKPLNTRRILQDLKRL